MITNLLRKLKNRQERNYIKKTVNTIIHTIDMEQFHTYQQLYKDADPPPGYSKYLNVNYWMTDHFKYIIRLNLHHSTPLNILDIGTGCGYFPYLCRYFGHSVMAVDLDSVPMYNEITRFLKVERRVWEIKAFQKLPDFGCKFDLVTALGICFNNHNKPDVWGPPEWSYFIEDLKTNQLSENGQIFLKLNAEKLGGYYNENLLNLFHSKEAVVDGRYIHISNQKS